MAKALKRYAKFYSLDDLIAAQPAKLGEGEFTVMQLKDKLECTYERAVSRLKEWERDGSVVVPSERETVCPYRAPTAGPGYV